MTQRTRELLESKLPTTSVPIVRSNSISEISTEIVVKGEVERKSSATVSCSPPLLRRAKSSPNLKDSGETVESTHDSFFNNKQRVIYESSLAALLLQNLEPFMDVMQKVSSLIIPDLFKLADSKETLSPTSEKLYAHFIKDSNVKTAFSPELLKIENRAAFTE